VLPRVRILSQGSRWRWFSRWGWGWWCRRAPECLCSGNPPRARRPHDPCERTLTEPLSHWYTPNHTSPQAAASFNEEERPRGMNEWTNERTRTNENERIRYNEETTTTTIKVLLEEVISYLRRLANPRWTQYQNTNHYSGVKLMLLLRCLFFAFPLLIKRIPRSSSFRF